MSASPADLLHLPSRVDIATLMLHVLAGNPPDEEIDTKLRHVLRDQYPQAEEALFTIIAEMLSAQQRMLGITRQQAAALVAKGQSEMTLSPKGSPLIKTMQVETAGLERLPSGQREQLLKELEGALPMSMAMSKPIPHEPQMLPEWDGDNSSWTALRTIAIIAVLAAVFFLGYLLGKG